MGDEEAEYPAPLEQEQEEEQASPKPRIEAPKVDKAQLVSHWYSFFTSFKRKIDSQPMYIERVHDMAQKKSVTLTVNYIHIRDFTKLTGIGGDNAFIKSLTDAILQNYTDCMDSMRTALRDVMMEQVAEYATNVDIDRLQVGVQNIPIRMEIDQINDTYIGRPLTVEGLVTSVDEPLTFVRKACYVCHVGHENYVLSHGTQHKPLSKCFSTDSDGDACGSTNLYLDETKSTTDSFQLVRLQQRMDKVRPGNMPQVLECLIFGRDRLNMVKPGDFASISGAIGVRMKEKKQLNSLGTFYLDVSGVEVKDDEFAYDDPLLMEQVKKAVAANSENKDFERLCRSIAPSIKGHEPVKKACLLLLAGSDSRKMMDGGRHRGDVQLFFDGDPGTGKTKIAKFMMRVFFRSVFNSGRGSTKAGLTLAVNIDKASGIKRLEAGSYPLASSKHGGLVVIDELEKMDKEEHQILAEVMDDEQTTSKNAAGFHVTLDLHCSSIHCANPVLKETNGRYDRSKTLLENSGMDAWLLSRYDAVFVFTDEIDAKGDEEKVRHWMSHFNLSVTEEQYDSSAKYMTMNGLSNDEDYWPVAFMRYWGHYVRETFHPRLDPNSEAGQELMKFYLKLRAGSQQFGTKITMRDLGALIRFSEASARAHHRNDVQVKDAKIAIELVSTAIASSGFNPVTGVTMMDVPQRQKNQDARKNKITTFIKGVNAVSRRECEACHGTGNVPLGPSSAYGSFGEKCELCDNGYVEGQQFKGSTLVKELAKKMTEDEVRVYLKDANDKMLLIYSGNDTYQKIPNAWMEYCVKMVPGEFGLL